MNKFDKLRLALILQDIEALYSQNSQQQAINTTASTAGTLMANIDEDGFDKQDIAKLMVDQMADKSPNGLMFKVQNNLALHGEELAKAFTEVGDQAGLQALQNGDLKTLYKSISALVYNLLKNKNHHLGVILATILVPIVNTFIFIIGSLIFFNGVFGQLISLFIAANFIIEFVINLLLSPSIYYIVNLFKKRKA